MNKVISMILSGFDQQQVTEEDMVYLVDYYVLAGPKWYKVEMLKKYPKTWAELHQMCPGVADRISKTFDLLYSAPVRKLSFFGKVFQCLCSIVASMLHSYRSDVGSSPTRGSKKVKS